MEYRNPVSSQERFRKLFTEGFKAKDIAEPLISFDADRPAAEVKEFMVERKLRVIGLREQGIATGYGLVNELGDGQCSSYLHPFGDHEIVTDDAPLNEVIATLDKNEYCVVSVLGDVVAIISKTDIQKPPVRMWLFGMIVIIEMFIVRKVEEIFPDKAWIKFLSAGRLEKAYKLREERRRRNQDPRLLDCLQFSDKTQILLQDEAMREDFGWESKKQALTALARLESLRNNLSHSQDILTHDWDSIVVIAGRFQRILTRV